MTQALIIDDDADNLDVLRQALEIEGVECTSIRHPSALEKTLQRLKHLDVIFLDLELPCLDGYQILDFLKSNASLRNIPVVAYSVHVSELSTAHARGFHSFLGKPLDVDKFPIQLAQILRGEGVWSAL